MNGQENWDSNKSFSIEYSIGHDWPYHHIFWSTHHELFCSMKLECYVSLHGFPCLRHGIACVFWFKYSVLLQSLVCQFQGDLEACCLCARSSWRMKKQDFVVFANWNSCVFHGIKVTLFLFLRNDTVLTNKNQFAVQNFLLLYTFKLANNFIFLQHSSFPAKAWCILFNAWLSEFYIQAYVCFTLVVPAANFCLWSFVS